MFPAELLSWIHSPSLNMDLVRDFYQMSDWMNALDTSTSLQRCDKGASLCALVQLMNEHVVGLFAH